MIHVTINDNRLVVDFGFDGTVDAQFKRSQVQRLRVLGGGGDDGMSVDGSGVGDLPITENGGLGNDFLGVVGNIGDLGDGDLPVTMNGTTATTTSWPLRPARSRFRAEQATTSSTEVAPAPGRRPSHSATATTGSRASSTASSPGEPEATSSTEAPGRTAWRWTARSPARRSPCRQTPGTSSPITPPVEIDADNIQDVSWVGFGGLDEGGGDQVAVNDLSSTDVVNFTPDFTDPLDNIGPNNSADQVTVRGTAESTTSRSAARERTSPSPGSPRR